MTLKSWLFRSHHLGINMWKQLPYLSYWYVQPYLTIPFEVAETVCVWIKKFREGNDHDHEYGFMFSRCEEQKGHQESSLRISWIRFFDASEIFSELWFTCFRKQKSLNKSKNLSYSSKYCCEKVYPRGSQFSIGRLNLPIEGFAAEVAMTCPKSDLIKKRHHLLLIDTWILYPSCVCVTYWKKY